MENNNILEQSELIDNCKDLLLELKIKEISNFQISDMKKINNFLSE
jgi:hypothetical protein